MKNRLYRYLLTISILSILITTFFTLITNYSVINKQVFTTLQSRAIFLSEILNSEKYDKTFFNNLTLDNLDYRITLIESNGDVYYDSAMDKNNLENHLNRPEIQGAIAEGTGMSARYSDTLGVRTFYYSILLNNGNILRVSKNVNDIHNIFTSTLPVIGISMFLSFLICNYLSRIFVKKVIYPINNIDINSDNIETYDELSVLVKTIKKQRATLKSQLNDLENRTNTIITITENMNEGLILFNTKSEILLVNKSVLTLFSITDEDVLGKNCINIIRDLNLQNALSKSSSGEIVNYNFEINGKYITAILSPVYQNEDITGVVALFIDVSEKASSEKLRREFTANVSHELRTPLTTILGISELLYNDMVDKDNIKNFSGKIKAESERLLYLIEDIIKLSQLDEKAFDETFEVFSLDETIKEVINTLNDKISDKNINLSYISNDLSITANKQMIFELIYNLIDNAIKYNNDQGSVSITTSKLINKTKIVISDNGFGIDTDDQVRIFERFYRADKSRFKKTGGSGLGLSIVKHIVEYHNGTIELSSSVNSGSTFTILI